MGVIQVRDVRIGEGMPKVCIPVVGRSEQEILAGAERAAGAGADVIEWRLDYYDGWQDPKACAALSLRLRPVIGEIPLLVTFRTAAEGGEQRIGEEDYLFLYKTILREGDADLIDVQMRIREEIVDDLIEYAHVHGAAVIVSNHEFHATPPQKEITNRLLRMRRMGADIAKIAVMPSSQEDVLTLLAATLQVRRLCPDQVLITMSMSGRGVVSRIAGEAFGSAMTFGTAGAASAPGQVDARALRRTLELLHESGTEAEE